MTFDWKYALSKLLIFLTSTKNIVLAAGVVFATLNLDLSPTTEGIIVAGAVFLAAILKAWEDTQRI